MGTIRPRRGILRTAATLLMAFASLSPCAHAEALSSASLKAAQTYSTQTGGKSLIVWRGGRILHETYTGGGKPTRPVHVRSIAKTLWALAVLNAADAGKFRLDDPAAALITEWRAASPQSKITIRQLLNMTSGLAPSGSKIYGDGAKDLAAVTVKLKSDGPPGQFWSYGASSYESLGEILRRAYRGPAGAEAWLYQSVCKPAAMNFPELRRDKKSIAFCSAGAAMTARDLLNLGAVVLNNGRSSSGKQVVDPASLRLALTGTRQNPIYGMGFWLNTAAARPDAVACHMEDLLDQKPGHVDWARVCFSRLAPPDMSVMLGSSGQRVYVIPSWNTVIVRQGENSAFRDEAFLALLFR